MSARGDKDRLYIGLYTRARDDLEMRWAIKFKSIILGDTYLSTEKFGGKKFCMGAVFIFHA